MKRPLGFTECHTPSLGGSLEGVSPRGMSYRSASRVAPRVASFTASGVKSPGGILALCGLMAVVAGCSGSAAPLPSGSPGGGDGDPMGANAGTAGTGSTPGGGAGGAIGGGASGVGRDGENLSEDPYAVPAEAPAPALVETARLARLSHKQLLNAAQAVLKLPDVNELADNLTGDPLVGFDVEADALNVTEQLRREWADGIEMLAEQVVADAAALARLVPADAPADAAGRADAFIKSFGLSAYRRPLTDEEVATHQELFNKGATLYPDLDAFAAGASLVLQAMLQSPHFMYRTELSTPEAGSAVATLNDYEVASKLSFALVNTMPDEALFAAAAAGELKDRANVRAHAERLLSENQRVAGFNNLNAQMYRLGAYQAIRRDAELFPQFSPDAPDSMAEETLAFFQWIFDEGLGIKDVYTAPVGFVNAKLAPLYAVEGDFGDALQRYDFDPSQRSGLLTQPGFLSSYITGLDEPDIIHRGVFIAERVLCVVLPPPKVVPPPLPELEEGMTNRGRVETVTGKGTCGEGCHTTLLNPPGYAFENYDAVGTYRTMDHGQPVNAASEYMLDGKVVPFKDGIEFSHLVAESKQAHSCYASKLMSYLHGRQLQPADNAMVDYYARLSRAGEISLHDLELDIVTNDAFLTRLP